MTKKTALDILLLLLVVVVVKRVHKTRDHFFLHFAPGPPSPKHASRTPQHHALCSKCCRVYETSRIRSYSCCCFTSEHVTRACSKHSLLYKSPLECWEQKRASLQPIPLSEGQQIYKALADLSLSPCRRPVKGCVSSSIHLAPHTHTHTRTHYH